MEEREREARVERIIDSFALNDVRVLKEALKGAHATEIAQAIRHIEPEEQDQIINLLAPEDAGEVLLALRDVDEGAGIELAEELDSDDLSEILNVMEPDDAADVVADLPEEDIAEVLDLMEDEGSRSVQELLKYEEDTAGGIMTTEFTALSADETTDEAIKHLRENPAGRQIFYIYVIGAEGEFLGTVPIDRLITEGPQAKLGDMAVPNIISVTPDTDREEAAILVFQYDMLTLPVVDGQGRLLGVVTIDDAMDAMQDEATEDMYKLAGTSDDELLSKSALKVARIRLPWLFICLVGSLFSGFVIRLFSGTISEAIAIASFIPAIMSMGGNTGLQSSTATVRGIATGYISLTRVAGVILKEMRTALFMGVVCGVFMACVAFLWKGGQITLGIVVGISIFLAVSLSATMGVLIPITFKRINVDPAVASGPLITMINDITGLVVYLTMSTILLSRLT